MNYAIVLAGGKGQRFGNGQILKQFIELTGVPMIVYSLQIRYYDYNLMLFYLTLSFINYTIVILSHLMKFMKL